MNKPRPPARPLGVLARPLLADSFARQGFASAELVTRWSEVAGRDIAMICQPVKIQWPRATDPAVREPGTLVLRAEGPAAIEIQHLSDVILERVNRYFGWRAVSRLALRQAPLSRQRTVPRFQPDPARTAQIAASLPAVEDEGLKAALARLGASIKRT